MTGTFKVAVLLPVAEVFFQFPFVLAFVTLSSKDYIIDKLGEPLITLNSGTSGEGFSEDFALIDDNGSCYFMNRYGKSAFRKTYSAALPFSGGFAAIREEGLWGFINDMGATAITPQYMEARSFSNGLAAVKNAQGLWGYIDTAGTLKIDYRYAEPGNFSDGFAVSMRDGSWYIVDKSGSEALLY